MLLWGLDYECYVKVSGMNMFYYFACSMWYEHVFCILSRVRMPSDQDRSCCLAPETKP